MERYCSFAASGRTSGCYLRREFQNDIVLNRVYQYKELRLGFSRRATRVSDLAADEMVRLGFIDAAAKANYVSRVSEVFTGQGVYLDSSWEEIYQIICALRKECLGAESLEKLRAHQMRGRMEFLPSAIDQRAKKDTLLQKSKAVVVALCESAFYSVMLDDLSQAEGKEIYFLVGDQKGELLPTAELMPSGHYLVTDPQKGVAYDADLQSFIDQGEACLLVYGEDGLLSCRDLKTDAFVYALPRGFQARATVNCMVEGVGCAVYIPRGFDVTKWVRIISKTRISYWHLAKLWEDHGDAIYDLSPVELYQKYPQYFVDIYQNGAHFCDWKLPISAPSDMEDFDRLQEAAVKTYLDGFSNVSYYSKYFDEHLEEQPICRDTGKPQPGILVQAVRVKKARAARVMACEKGSTLREMFLKSGEKGTAVVSNFLFFLTASLANLYNELRADRPMEQADITAGHIDYMLYERDGKRIETFPLFRKTCVAMKEDGEFLFFNFRLGGGTVTLGDQKLCWSKADVDPAQATAPVCVYTPYLSVPDGEADRGTYAKPVGEERVNIVILQDKITCIRKGDVILPGIGVVLSLDTQLGEELLKKLRLPALQDGYYDVKGLEFSVHLEAPHEIDPADWERVCWSYGGGLSLILDGKGLCDTEDMDRWFEEEGWMSPLSRQTQESSLHTLVKHPRTAIGTTQNGDLVILVFSGRTWRSTGADYREMITIARRLFPDVKSLMNVDGGGSAMLGMTQDGKFMELSCPSSSGGSIVGMVRPINTVFYLPAEE